jgi:hypothetical protein
MDNFLPFNSVSTFTAVIFVSFNKNLITNNFYNNISCDPFPITVIGKILDHTPAGITTTPATINQPVERKTFLHPNHRAAGSGHVLATDLAHF